MSLNAGYSLCSLLQNNPNLNAQFGLLGMDCRQEIAVTDSNQFIDQISRSVKDNRLILILDNAPELRAREILAQGFHKPLYRPQGVSGQIPQDAVVMTEQGLAQPGFVMLYATCCIALIQLRGYDSSYDCQSALPAFAAAALSGGSDGRCSHAWERAGQRQNIGTDKRKPRFFADVGWNKRKSGSSPDCRERNRETVPQLLRQLFGGYGYRVREPNHCFRCGHERNSRCTKAAAKGRVNP